MNQFKHTIMSYYYQVSGVSQLLAKERKSFQICRKIPFYYKKFFICKIDDLLTLRNV